MTGCKHLSSNLICLTFSAFLIFTGCASSPTIQPQINSLSVAGKYQYAAKILDNQPESYGHQNRLLYLLDYGLISHYASKYEKSIRLFEEAKKLYDEQYTVSLSNQASTWLINDNLAPYRGEDFERVMINIFQALNYALLGNMEESLVEVRNADNALKLINRQYKIDQQNVYREDGFARLLMGILYETEGTADSLNDAHISYKKALDVYENDYQANYHLKIPAILKENLLATAQWMGGEDASFYRGKFPDVHFLTLEEKQNKAEIYFVCYQGLSPIKIPEAIPIPLPDGYIAKLTFPRYDQRETEPLTGGLKAVDSSEHAFETAAEPVENIDAIAQLNLRNRKVRVLAKAVLRSAGKYLIERNEEKSIHDEYGENTANAFRYISNLFNLASEQPDLRSWQTLPAQIYLARLVLAPGVYTVYFQGKKTEEITLKKGEKKIITARFAP